MADGKKIVIDFAPNGKATVGAQGYTGGECLLATAPFEHMFKKQVSDRVMVGDECRKDPGERVNV